MVLTKNTFHLIVILDEDPNDNNSHQLHVVTILAFSISISFSCCLSSKRSLLHIITFSSTSTMYMRMKDYIAAYI